MKHSYLLFVILFGVLGQPLQAQTTQTVSILPGYSHDTYYSFDNGAIAQVPADNWDIGFEIQGLSASIRVNSQKGVELREFPGATPAEWASVDTTGMASWEVLHDSDTSWQVSAFTRIGDPNDDFDLGWGGYDLITHQVVGSHVYLLSLSDGSYKKIKINTLAGGVYDFTFANLDGSGELTRQIDKADFSGKNFGYYDFALDSILDREPLSENWDLLFHQYFASLGGGVWYPVTGVMTNAGLTTAQIDGIDPEQATLSDTVNGFSSNISEIGNDWKDINFMTSQWDIIENRSYFVKKGGDKFYHLTFTAFGGSSNGNYEFILNELNASTSIDAQYAEAGWAVFPNPASNQLNIRLEESFVADAKLQLFDQQGRQVHQSQLPAFQYSHQMELSALPSGLYWLSLEANGQIWTQSVMKQ